MAGETSKYGLLGMLTRKQSYAYDLTHSLRRILGPGWVISDGQASNLLRSLDKAGLIEHVCDPNPARNKRHGRKVFRITTAGQAEFDRWYAEDDTDDPPLGRRTLILKLTFTDPAALEEAHRKVDAYETRCVRALQVRLEILDKLPPRRSGLSVDVVHLGMSLHADVHQLEGEFQWIGEVREELDWMMENEVTWTSSNQRESAQRERERRISTEQLLSRLAKNSTQTATGAHEQTASRDPSAPKGTTKDHSKGSS